MTKTMVVAGRRGNVYNKLQSLLILGKHFEEKLHMYHLETLSMSNNFILGNSAAQDYTVPVRTKVAQTTRVKGNRSLGDRGEAA